MRHPRFAHDAQDDGHAHIGVEAITALRKGARLKVGHLEQPDIKRAQDVDRGHGDNNRQVETHRRRLKGMGRAADFPEQQNGKKYIVDEPVRGGQKGGIGHAELFERRSQENQCKYGEQVLNDHRGTMAPCLCGSFFKQAPKAGC